MYFYLNMQKNWIFLNAEICEEVMIMAKKPLYKSLYFQVIIAIIAGVLVGHFFPSSTEIVDGVKKKYSRFR